ncbi:hypothetical protein A374_08964 [Fictibacillus macauensis ZFHKF-1]|uniref:Uncharacterized protein n=1 Tax=Fictibacillus macauensis ZFHKF-1 TaxID=1196324 RepID=I8AK90_9BACL|nr:hypothetical protein [Fictibacillus macauensis]EIT85954.1 hypothetical protein A374_08964 [Fictibacillus macauensis ZFHKF-1]
MKGTLPLMPSDRQMIETAVASYQMELGGYHLRLFNIAAEKVLTSQPIDGMEFKYIMRALNKYAYNALETNKADVADSYWNLAKWVQHSLARFQKKNGPKVMV